ncbi:hydroxyacylglutathione hydrolase [Alteromonas sp. C1M14]|uniref:hydroxyacylglutathione hydrolase n=1 Tax=Alteromonas sp. C1M14 TaxID=2841567 RepID=UPI001C08AD6E|nr:hydroxyacylglutathione hydrolase [Alteromonas sp. C1M14]MBU2979718.1 hydroxyacylglutathione hydrolase [Alteromonas sp. C1M14]
MNPPSSSLPDQVVITPVQAFSDNYIWCLHDDKAVVVVDPGDATPVLAFCKQHNLTLSGILITHHHHDHTGGISQLVSSFPDIPVIGPSGGHIKGITQAVKQGDTITLSPFQCHFDVIEVPGHTLDHLAFYGHGVLFCGDTLFSGGCGRLFEGSPEQMRHSLNALQRLPEQTLVYCAHEYTQANMTFALAVEPNNNALQQHADKVSTLRKHQQITLPSSLAVEKSINPFLRSHLQTVAESAKEYAGHTLTDEDAIFATIRRWKDEF